jgi:nucleotide sugar dehydrogenase
MSVGTTRSEGTVPDAEALKQAFAAEGAGRPTVCVQGLGFVGAAMATAVASARGEDGQPLFNVIGVDLPTADGHARIQAVARGEFPFPTTDAKLTSAIKASVEAGNLKATDDDRVYGMASVVLIDVNFDLDRSGEEPRFAMGPFRKALASIGRHVRPDALVIVETTVPPGTCAKVVAPELAGHLRERGLPEDQLLLAHAYERVMPGDHYLDSIVNFWRVYSGHTPAAADACEAFLSALVNTRDFPLRRLESTTASETAKVLENSYRAVSIAMMEEWGRFAEVAGVDLFEVVSAIRVRPTHSNMRTPGLGVGGYCLTKDPLFAAVAARDLFEAPEINFPFSARAVDVNAAMPSRACERLRQKLGSLSGKRILLLGLAYRPDVGDTRSSPSFDFWRDAEQDGAIILPHDPLVASGPETGGHDPSVMPAAGGVDAVVFAVDHQFYRDFDFEAWLEGNRPAMFDTNGVLPRERREEFRRLGCAVISVGRGDDQ